MAAIGESPTSRISTTTCFTTRGTYEEFEGEKTAELDAVDILTVHQAKGLEWPVVFLPALVDGRFPTRLVGRPQSWLLPDLAFPAEVRQRYEGSDAEECRLFHVGLTRARDCVYASAFEEAPLPHYRAPHGRPPLRFRWPTKCSRYPLRRLS